MVVFDRIPHFESLVLSSQASSFLVPPVLPAVLLQASFPVLIFEVAYVCENSAFPVVTSAHLPGPVAPSCSVILEAHWVSVEQYYSPADVRTASAATFAVVVAPSVSALIPAVSTRIPVATGSVGFPPVVSAIAATGSFGPLLCCIL